MGAIRNKSDDFTFKPRTLVLTKKQCETLAGKRIASMIFQISSDGQLTAKELAELRDELTKEEYSAIPGAGFLVEVISDALEDGLLTIAEKYEIKRSLLRVMPPPEREEIKELLAKVEAPATEAQLDFIHGLGGFPLPEMTTSQASAMIDSLLEAKEQKSAWVPHTSTRQQMVLRFWDRLDLEPKGREAVSAWMDGWYKQNPSRKDAWERFKEEHNPQLAEDVPIGVGEKYLKKASGCFGLIVAGCILCGAAKTLHSMLA